MKNKILIILVTSLGFLSCNTDVFKIIENNESTESNENNDYLFTYIETNSFDDYFGESKLLIYNKNQIRVVNSSINFFQFQTLESEIIYKNESEILKFNPNTNQTTVLVQLQNIQINSFHISPNQKYLAYSNYKDIILMDLENETTENITIELEGNFRLPKWSPDGNSILIINEVPKIRIGDNAPTATGSFKVYSIIKQNFQDIEMFDEFAYPFQAEWSPNSEMVVYGQHGSVFIFNINSQLLSRVTSEEIVATNPKFSKNGKMLSYFSSDQSDNGNNWQNFLTIYNLENRTNKVVNSSYSYDASWKSDSSIILYSTENGIFLYKLETESIQNLIESDQSKFLHSTQFLE